MVVFGRHEPTFRHFRRGQSATLNQTAQAPLSLPAASPPLPSPPPSMPARPGPASQEGYPSSSPPSADAHSNDPFTSAQGRRYYDNESDNIDFGRREGYRETYASDGSNLGINDYDQNGTYDYRLYSFCHVHARCSMLLQLFKTLIPTVMFMVNAMLHPQNH